MFSPVGQLAGIQTSPAPVQRAFDAFLKVKLPPFRWCAIRSHTPASLKIVDVDTVMARRKTPIEHQGIFMPASGQ